MSRFRVMAVAMDTVMGGSDGSRLACVPFVSNNNNVGPRNLIIGDDTYRYYSFLSLFLFGDYSFLPLCFFGGKKKIIIYFFNLLRRRNITGITGIVFLRIVSSRKRESIMKEFKIVKKKKISHNRVQISAQKSQS